MVILNKQLKDVLEEHEILKKIVKRFSKSVQIKFRFIKEFTVKKTCEFLKVSTSN